MARRNNYLKYYFEVIAARCLA